MLNAVFPKRYGRATLSWIAFAFLNAVIGGYFTVALLAPASSIKSSWLPGETTHGHYQIELKCNECHGSASSPDATDVMQDACNRCHADQLKRSKDTHPAKKFSDPTKADLLQILNAQDCLACHQEHMPERTLAMGLTMPSDYCWHCHQDVAESRPSHQGMAFDSCATAGCHNYHDNRSLNEKFLDDHFGEPEFFDVAQVPPRRSHPQDPQAPVGLVMRDADHPNNVEVDSATLKDWAETSHASAGVNCSDCHGAGKQWSNEVTMDSCRRCHEMEVERFMESKHGMRLAVGLSPMTPDLARLPMSPHATHRELDCNACHQGHRFDTEYAAAEACLQCHQDDHSLAYLDSSHATLWQDEITGGGQRGTGVSCATCHLPRLEGDDGIFVQHDQSSNLRPNEKMAREVCLHCHGLEFSLSALADTELIRRQFDHAPLETVPSVQMARDWFESRAKRRKRRGGG
ncbi:MAG: cytochrome c3 family protein [Planctomycetota bacterium]